ncbi:hypothetical protein OIU76_029703 [Salix suchowensis]|nr:hypothetical protein OIU76_029703 [Salix suchowensis]
MADDGAEVEKKNLPSKTPKPGGGGIVLALKKKPDMPSKIPKPKSVSAAFGGRCDEGEEGSDDLPEDVKEGSDDLPEGSDDLPEDVKEGSDDLPEDVKEGAHQLYKNPRPNPDIKTLFIDHTCPLTNGPLAPAPVNLPVVVVAKPASYTSLGAHGV